MTHSRGPIETTPTVCKMAGWGVSSSRKTRFFTAKCKNLSSCSTKDHSVMIALSNGASHIHQNPPHGWLALETIETNFYYKNEGKKVRENVKKCHNFNSKHSSALILYPEIACQPQFNL